MRLSRSIRSSGTLTVPMCTSPPNPVGTPRPVSVLQTVVFPEPAKPTRPTFTEHLVHYVIANEYRLSGARCQTLVRDLTEWSGMDMFRPLNSAHPRCVGTGSCNFSGASD